MPSFSIAGPYPLCPECGSYLIPIKIDMFKKKIDHEVTEITWKCTKCDILL